MLTARQNGGIVSIRNEEGRRVASYNAVELAKRRIALGSAEAFAAQYGFRWNPTRSTLLEAQRQLKTAARPGPQNAD